jgi:hypothetical protein
MSKREEGMLSRADFTFDRQRKKALPLGANSESSKANSRNQ